jgi:hypothetical protein
MPSEHTLARYQHALDRGKGYDQTLIAPGWLPLR